MEKLKLHTQYYIIYNFFSTYTIFTLNYIILKREYFAAGDSCFYIGLSGKEHASAPSFEPYQCCRSSEKKYSSNNNAQNGHNGKSSKKDKTTVTSDSKSKSKVENDYSKGRASPQEKEKNVKGKKGIHNSADGKYIWWW